jgi:hypothetical protein
MITTVATLCLVLEEDPTLRFGGEPRNPKDLVLVRSFWNF